MCFGEASDYVAVPLFCICVFFSREGDSAKTIPYGAVEILVGQIPLKPHTFLAVAVQQEDSRRPDRVIAVEPCRMFLDVSFDGKKVFADEVRRRLILVRFGIQPSTGPSSRSGAEIQQNCARLFLCHG
jgi:hypothetical protein